MSDLSGFLAKHAVELQLVAATLSTVVSALPLDAQDKENAKKAIDALSAAAGNIAASATDMAKAPKVIIKKSDIEAAVKAQLPTLIKAELAKQNKA